MRIDGLCTRQPFKILPTVFNDALSYYENIQKLTVYVNDAIKYIEGLGDNNLAEAKEYTDSRVQEIYNTVYRKYDVWINDVDKRLTDKLNEVDTREVHHYGEVKEAINKLNTDIITLYVYINDFKANVNGQINGLYTELIDYIDEHIGKITQINVLNPVTGMVEPINKVLDDIFNNSVGAGALTAEEFDDLHITADKLDSMYISAYAFTVRLRWVFFEWLYLRMISPFDGRLDFFSNIINKLADLHKTPITASEFDNKGYTADSFDELNVTAYDFDWKANIIL